VSNNSALVNTMYLGEGNGSKYKLVFKIDNFNLIVGTYEVAISYAGIANFKNTNNQIQYWIVFEAKDSIIGE
jgi:hypothetical protein